MSRQILTVLIMLATIGLAGCMEDGGERDDSSPAVTDERIPPLDDPGWSPFNEAGIPREINVQQFQRINFYQEPEAAEEEGNPGTPGFDLDQLEEDIGPLDSGTVYNSEQDFPPSWDILFHDVNRDNRSVQFEHMVDDGDEYEVDGLPGQITMVIDDEAGTIANRLDLEEGGTFYVETESDLAAAGFAPGAYRVTAVEADAVHLDHHPAEEAQQQQPGMDP